MFCSTWDAHHRLTTLPKSAIHVFMWLTDYEVDYALKLLNAMFATQYLSDSGLVSELYPE